MTRSATRVIDTTSTIVRQSGRGRFMIVRGPDRGESVAIGAKPVVFGSGTGADFVLADPTVSRRHLVAEQSSSGLVVRDVGSTNGSFVQGARFQELILGFGAEVQIGQTVLKYVPEEEPVDLPPAEEDAFGAVYGRDDRLRKLFRLLGDVSATEATVLLEGETGTGKELFAEEIHCHSPRSAGPFVVFDCGAVPHELIESALFGHVRGAFTGATSDRRGAFVEANGGTLFLDEIGEMSMDIQPALLRALDKRAIRPVGGTAYESVSVRVVAATNRDLRSEVSARRFREDLYYRLAVVRVVLPPLRDRPGDIALLAERFIEQLAGGRQRRLAPEDMERLRRHTWPGNVRELRNVIERACALSRGDTLDLGDALATGRAGTPAPSTASATYALPFKEAKAQIVDAFEREYMRALLERHGGNLSAASRDAEIDRKHLRELLRKHGLREEE